MFNYAVGKPPSGFRNMFGNLFRDELIDTNPKSFISIIGPGTIRSNTLFKIAVISHYSEESCEIKIDITGPVWSTSKVVKVQPKCLEQLEFEIPKLEAGQYELRAQGISDLDFNKSCILNFEQSKPLTIIQTDKAIYKPGDLVQFRILFMDESTCPVNLESPTTIKISDGDKNLLKQWENIKPYKGVYTDKYRLSEQPVLGQWLIEVCIAGSSVEFKSFEVDKYVLPKFSVAIETARNVPFYAGVIHITVRSKYTYGKGVKGKALISIKPDLHCYGNCKSVEKIIDISGKGSAEFNLVADLNIKEQDAILPKLNVHVTVEEDLTGSKQEATETIQLHKHRFILKQLEKPREFFVGESLIVRIAVRNVDETPVLDSKHTVKLNISPVSKNFFNANSRVEPIELTARLNEHGIAVFKHTFMEDNIGYCNMQCSYLEVVQQLGTVVNKNHITQYNTEQLKLSVVTPNPQLGEVVKISIVSREEIPYFVYAIVGRGKLLRSDIVHLPAGTKDYTLEIAPTFEMLPDAFVYVHYMVGPKLCFEETDIRFGMDLLNKISITAPLETSPGEETLIKVTTSPDSFIGLLGVDQSVLLLKSDNDIDKARVFKGLSKIKTMSPRRNVYGRYPGEKSGLFTLTNIVLPQPPQIMYQQSSSGLFGATAFRSRAAMGFTAAVVNQVQPFGKRTKLTSEVQIRKEFPENWIFENIQSNESGIVSFSKRVPDTITSWVLTGFSLCPQIGLGLTEIPTTIKTFRPFFISTNLPYAVRRGEHITVPILVFNYMAHNLKAEVVLDNTDFEYEFTDDVTDQTKRIKNVEIKANTGTSIDFPICPKNIGLITLKISAQTALAGDAIHQKLRVEPEGITVFKNEDFFLYTAEEVMNLQNTVILDIPEYVVEDSELIEVSLMGNILGSTIANIDKLVRMPYGCGEQNMVNFVPNIFVLWYLESIGELEPVIENKAKNFLEIGYQRELTYKHTDGSYSAFGKSDSSGSTWLTAYVIRSFHQAKRYIDISQTILDEGLNFLARTQSSNGSFPEIGRVVDFSHMNNIGLTAFVLLAFLENEESVKKYKKVIENGFKYLEKNFTNTKDLYALSIVLYALQQHKSDKVVELLAKLESLSCKRAGQKWWTQNGADHIATKRWCSNSHDVEITGYIFMTLLERNTSVLPITKWLLLQRNSNGGFASTQETVVGLWALIKFAQKCGVAHPEISLELTVPNEQFKNWKLNVDKKNSLIVQTLELPKNTRQITFKANGTGSGILQVSYRYNIREKEIQPSFKLSTQMKSFSVSKKMLMDVFIEFLSDFDKASSNMTVMEVFLPTGYTALTDIFEKNKEIENVKRIETREGNTCIVIYFDFLKAAETKCIPIEAALSHDVTGQKPVPIVIYDYYDSQKRATDFYSLN